MIIGILSALLFPGVLNQVNKAREAEAKTYIGAVNRAQSARLIEAEDFGTLADLGNIIPTQTQSYNYTASVLPKVSATVVASPRTPGLRPISGLVVLEAGGNTASALCPGTAEPSLDCPQ